jgi:hypothetical protein
VLAQPSPDVVALRQLKPRQLPSYDNKVDVWALGVLVYESLMGVTPFGHPDPEMASLQAQFRRPAPLRPGVSSGCADFVARVLTKQAGLRPSAAQLLGHPWVQQHLEAADVAAHGAAAQQWWVHRRVWYLLFLARFEGMCRGAVCPSYWCVMHQLTDLLLAPSLHNSASFSLLAATTPLRAGDPASCACWAILQPPPTHMLLPTQPSSTCALVTLAAGLEQCRLAACTRRWPATLSESPPALTARQQQTPRLRLLLLLQQQVPVRSESHLVYRQASAR